METYREFLDRINSFQHKELNLGQNYFNVNPNLLKKVNKNNVFSDFYGDTVVFDLDNKAKDIINNITDELYKNAEECFCQKLVPNTFHMTLHDLNNSSVLNEIYADMVNTEVLLKEKLKISPIEKQTIKMNSYCIFNMLNTSMVLGLYPNDEAEYNKLMILYNSVEEIKSLPYPLTPHITLAYFNRNGFSENSSNKLERIVNLLNKNDFEIMLSTDKLVYQHFTNMNNYKSIFSFT